jgi:hypothetical protein
MTIDNRFLLSIWFVYQPHTWELPVLIAAREALERFARIRPGPPPGFFRIGWVRSFPSLTEFFVHHEDGSRSN